MLKNDMCFAPFMGDSRAISVGLNPLGIRTASEQLFTTLLPGLNVVTLRIRYYSFYCWLLKTFYAHRADAKRIDLQRHIRMSELLMALIHAQSEHSSGVPGIERANKIIEEALDLINFSEDAMPEGKPRGGYWKGPYGAFGTYYAASLQEMGIIWPLEDNNKLYNVTLKKVDYISGEDLADAFEESIGEKKGKMFLECATTGLVTRKQLQEMEGVFQSHNLPENKENALLLDMLLQNDKPYTHKESKLRKGTLRLLLDYLKSCTLAYFSELQFSKYVYDNYKAGVETNLAALGWYAYYLNDSRQYEALNIFEAVLKRLRESTKPGQWESIDELTSELATKVCQKLNANGLALSELLAAWDYLEEPDDQMSHGFYVILDNYRRNADYKESKSTIRASYRNVSNDALDGFDEIERSMDMTVFDYVKKFLTEDIIYNHYAESMRKFSQNGIPTQKLAIESGYVRGIATYSPTHSSPRIDTLRNYATDLGLISNYRVTPKGENLLNSLNND